MAILLVVVLTMLSRSRAFRPLTRIRVTTRSFANDLAMENLYQAWTLEQDRLLWENRDRSVVELASLLGRGIRGVEMRLEKIQDVDSAAYLRLFDGSPPEEKAAKLIPCSEVLRRIKYDYRLDPADFSVLYYDRVDDALVECLMNAPNDSISGKEQFLVDALPEHRISIVKYRERVVWDREKRLDLMFEGIGIDSVIEGYDEWKRIRDQELELNRQRQVDVAARLQGTLGANRFLVYKELSNNLQLRTSDSKISMKRETERYLDECLTLFREAREDPSSSTLPMEIPRSDAEALDQLSEMAALLPNENLRGTILLEISLAIARAEGKKVNASSQRQLPPLEDDDLVETFVRGSGPGGQKINKTSNRVVLVHEPTQIRVECQETRSLQQNRKIARKRLQMKLDEYYNGSQSKTQMAARKASTKKARSKAKSRARQRKKQEANETTRSTEATRSEDEFY